MCLPEVDTYALVEGCIAMVILTTVTQPCYSVVTSNLKVGKKPADQKHCRPRKYS